MASHLDLDPEKVTAVLREAAETEILPRFRALESHEIMEKGPGDLVTVADRASEKLLTRRLSGLIPTALMRRISSSSRRQNGLSVHEHEPDTTTCGACSN